jgi:acetylornithine deacetylase/succinyl-diaminopimelate desuccinylase-like protein
MTCFTVHSAAAISDQRLNGLIGRDATSGSQEKKMGTASFEYYQSSRERFLAGLTDLLKIPSISTLPEHRSDVRRACEFLADELRAMGMQQVDIIEGKANQNPLIYAEWNGAPGKPTLLLYGHYDVQPPDPLDEWNSPPFEPTVRGDNVFARGSSDDKGQTYILVKAVEGYLKAEGKLPVNVKFLIEGEEEVGGEHIEQYVRAHPDRLQADAAVICDTEMFAPELPTITTGLRGLVYTELEARGAAHDLHSGMYGGAAPNPFQALAEIISGLKGDDGKIRIPGFYKRVTRPTKKELAAWKQLPFKEKEFLKKEIGSTALVGEKGFGVLERLWARPTFEVHGIRGGFTGEGAKTVIPAVATAKVSMRLVPDMDPKEVVRAYTTQVKKLTPKGIVTKVRVVSTAPPSVVSTENMYIAAAAQAMEQVFRKKTVYMRSGGSIPVAGLLHDNLGIPVVMMGYGLPDDNLHAPNEKFHLPNFYRGIEAVGRYLELLGQ